MKLFTCRPLSLRPVRYGKGHPQRSPAKVAIPPEPPRMRNFRHSISAEWAFFVVEIVAIAQTRNEGERSEFRRNAAKRASSADICRVPLETVDDVTIGKRAERVSNSFPKRGRSENRDGRGHPLDWMRFGWGNAGGLFPPPTSNDDGRTKSLERVKALRFASSHGPFPRLDAPRFGEECRNRGGCSAVRGGCFVRFAEDGWAPRRGRLRIPVAFQNAPQSFSFSREDFFLKKSEASDLYP